MAGAYTSSIIRETEELLTRLDDAGKQPELYVYGRRGVTYYKYRNRAIADTWEGIPTSRALKSPRPSPTH